MTTIQRDTPNNKRLTGSSGVRLGLIRPTKAEGIAGIGGHPNEG